MCLSSARSESRHKIGLSLPRKAALLAGPSLMSVLGLALRLKTEARSASTHSADLSELPVSAQSFDLSRQRAPIRLGEDL